MDKSYIPYFFKAHKIGVLCEKKSGVIILEDIFQILYPSNWKEELDRKLPLINSEVNINTVKYRDAQVYTLCETDLREVYGYFDDAPNNDLFQELKEWLEDKLYYFLEIEEPKLGTIIPRLTNWNKELEKLFREFPNDKIYNELSIKKWLKEKYEIDIKFLLDIISKQIDNELASTYRSTTGKLPRKKGNANYYRYLDFVIITPKANELLMGSDFSWLEESLRKSKNNKKKNGYYYKYVSEHIPDVKRMFEENKSISEIINIAEENIFIRKLNKTEKKLIQVIVELIKNGGL